MLLEFDPVLHQYSADGVLIPSVSEILRSAGLADYSSVPENILERAADRGKKVHEACHYFDQDDLDPETLDKKIAPYVAAWRAFRLHCDGTLAITGIEEMHLGELNDLRFGMTVDRLAQFEGCRAILDIKTGSEIYKHHAIQLAGYAIGLESRGSAIQRVSNYRRLIVHLRRNATYQIHECTDDHDADVFAEALANYWIWG